MIQVYEILQEYGSTLSIDADEDYKFISMRITDCDGCVTRKIFLEPDDVGNLALVLSDWFDVSSRRKCAI